jgi:uncharacterized protein
MPRRLAVLAVTAVLALGALSGVASAHVTVDPGSAPRGGYATLTFRVPTEDDTASTVKLQVVLPDPATAPVASLRVQPHPGWSYEVGTTHLATPAQSDDGPVSDVVTQVTWTADTPGDGIAPGEFDEFRISLGPLPTKVASLTFKALQTYSDGDVVSWIQAAAPGGAEPEHPAPVLRLTDPSTGGGGGSAATAAGPTTGDVDGARALGVAGLVVGGLGLVVAAVALATGRRRPVRPDRAA